MPQNKDELGNSIKFNWLDANFKTYLGHGVLWYGKRVGENRPLQRAQCLPIAVISRVNIAVRKLQAME